MKAWSNLSACSVASTPDPQPRCLPLHRDGFPGVRLLAVHTTSPTNLRTLLSYEAEGKGRKAGDTALRLPEGHSRHVLAVDPDHPCK